MFDVIRVAKSISGKVVYTCSFENEFVSASQIIGDIFLYECFDYATLTTNEKVLSVTLPKYSNNTCSLDTVSA